jgi:hypothetical protein
VKSSVLQGDLGLAQLLMCDGKICFECCPLSAVNCTQVFTWEQVGIDSGNLKPSIGCLLFPVVLRRLTSSSSTDSNGLLLTQYLSSMTRHRFLMSS